MPVAFFITGIAGVYVLFVQKTLFVQKNVVRAKVFVNRYSVVYH